MQFPINLYTLSYELMNIHPLFSIAMLTEIHSIVSFPNISKTCKVAECLFSVLRLSVMEAIMLLQIDVVIVSLVTFFECVFHCCLLSCCVP